MDQAAAVSLAQVCRYQKQGLPSPHFAWTPIVLTSTDCSQPVCVFGGKIYRNRSCNVSSAVLRVSCSTLYLDHCARRWRTMWLPALCQAPCWVSGNTMSSPPRCYSRFHRGQPRGSAMLLIPAPGFAEGLPRACSPPCSVP